MITTKAAFRYAMALFQEARDRKSLKQVADDMQRISESISGSAELRSFLKSQIISREVKSKMLRELFGDDLSKLSSQFMELILEKRREDQLPAIAGAFGKLYRKEQGLVEVEVLVVRRPDKAQTKELKKALEKKTGNSVLLNFKEDPSLKGGMAVRIDDTVIDGTIKHKLQQLEASFQQTAM